MPWNEDAFASSLVSLTDDTVALYRTRSDDWTGRWWTTLTWEHVHTWRLRS
jgi:hypothetical protein